MSVEAMAWAFRQKLEDSQIKLILLALCDHCDDDGMCWPSHERLADKASCSTKTVQRRLNDLEDLRLITRRRRARKTAIYQVHLHKTPMTGQRVHQTQPKAQDVAQKNPLKQHFDRTKSLDDRTQLSPPNHQYKPSADSDSVRTESESAVPAFSLTGGDGPPSKRDRKRCQMPEAWEPDDRGVLFAKGKGFADERIRHMVQRCRDHHVSRGTMIAGTLGLAATWRTWVNTQVEIDERDRRRGNGPGGPRPLQDDSKSVSRAAARLAEAAERGDFEIGPRPSLLGKKGGDDIRLLPKG